MHGCGKLASKDSDVHAESLPFCLRTAALTCGSTSATRSSARTGLSASAASRFACGVLLSVSACTPPAPGARIGGKREIAGRQRPAVYLSIRLRRALPPSLRRRPGAPRRADHGDDRLQVPGDPGRGGGHQPGADRRVEPDGRLRAAHLRAGAGGGGAGGARAQPLLLLRHAQARGGGRHHLRQARARARRPVRAATAAAAARPSWAAWAARGGAGDRRKRGDLWVSSDPHERLGKSKKNLSARCCRLCRGRLGQEYSRPCGSHPARARAAL